MRGCKIDKFSQILHSILMDKVKVNEVARIENHCVLGENYEVESESYLNGFVSG